MEKEPKENERISLTKEEFIVAWQNNYNLAHRRMVEGIMDVQKLETIFREIDDAEGKGLRVTFYAEGELIGYNIDEKPPIGIVPPKT